MSRRLGVHSVVKLQCDICTARNRYVRVFSITKKDGSVKVKVQLCILCHKAYERLKKKEEDAKN